LVTV
jgi:hypothetical protein